MDSIVITSIARTPQGKLLGALKDMSAPELGSAIIKSLIERSNLKPNDIDEVILGCVLAAGLGQAPARQAALGAGLSIHTPCTTINKMCGSGMKSIMMAYDAIRAGSSSIALAGGMESMSNAPYLLPKGRQGYRLSHGEILDHMMVDGLEDAYQKRKPMGYFAEECAKEYGFSRNQQDQFAITSLERARKANDENSFKDELISLTLKNRSEIFNADEHPSSVKLEKISQLMPIFVQNGTITAANSCSISDGAAGVILMHEREAIKKNSPVLAKIIGHATFAKEPNLFTTAPIDAIRHCLNKVHWKIEDVDLFEINEAFAVVPMAAMRDLSIPHEKLNIHGGGCALGHPIGATGARIVVSLISALRKYGLKRGVAALCIGGGEATAIAIEVA